MEIWLDLLRRMTPAKKIAAVFTISQLALNLSEAGVRIAYPEADDREVFLRTAARRLSRDLMIRAYGWDPETNEELGCGGRLQSDPVPPTSIQGNEAAQSRA